MPHVPEGPHAPCSIEGPHAPCSIEGPHAPCTRRSPCPMYQKVPMPHVV